MIVSFILFILDYIPVRGFPQLHMVYRGPENVGYEINCSRLELRLFRGTAT